MAAMTLEPRDPDMAHFIDSYKFERQMEERRNKFGGGTSLPLNSDGYEDRQRFLREERHKDWVEQQEKDLSYKHTVNPYPHPKLTRGPQNRTNYDIEIQRMTDRYHNKYDDVLVKGDEQQRKMEQERFEQRRRNRQLPAPPQGNQIDYNEAQELAKAEERRAYQDYQGKFSNPVEGRLHVKAPVSYEENKKVLAEERRQDYAQYQEKKAKEERYRALRGRPVTPPGGLNIGQYDRQVKESKAQKTKEYKDMLDQQQKEQMFLKAQRDTEMSVLDRQRPPDSQYLATKPPAGPGYTKPRDEPSHQTQGYWNEGRRAPSPQSLASEAQRRQRDDGVPLEEERRRHLSNKPAGKPAEVVKGPYYSSDNYESYQTELRRKQINDYKDYLKKTSHVSKNRSWKESENGLLLPEDHSVEYRRRELQAQRKKEYNEHLAQSKGPPNHYWPEPEPGQGALWHKKGEYDGIKQMYQEERKKEFIDKLELKRQPDKFESPRAQTQPNPIRYSSFNPMVDSMGRYEELRHKLRDIRRKEFLDFMDKHRLEDRRHGNQPPELAKDENPLVFSMGRYELEQMKKVREEAHRDLAKFYEEQQKNMSPRRYEVEIPRLARAEDPIVNHLGSYDKEKEKFILQRHKDFREFSQKYKEQHHSPWNNFVYPLNAYLEHPVVEKMGHEMEEKRRVLRDERKRDYERYLSEQRMTEVPRRDGYGNNVAGPYDGMFHGLGEHGNQKDVLNQQRRQEYNDKLDQQYSQRERPTGRPSWAKDPMTDKQDQGDRGRTPLRSPVKPDHYEQMLHEKRREEAQRRRYDDPEYQEKLARMDSRERGPARDQPRYGY